MNLPSCPHAGLLLDMIVVTWTMDHAIEEFWIKHLGRKRHPQAVWPHVNAIRKFFTGRAVQNITYLDVENFRNEQLRTVSASTVNRRHGLITTLFNKLEEWSEQGIIPKLKLPKKNPGSKVKLYDETTRVRKRVVRQDEFSLFMSACDKDLRKICLMAVLTLLRKRDLMKLSKANIDTYSNMLSGIQTKTGKPYQIPISEPIQMIINDSHGPKILDFTNFKRKFYAARKKSGVSFWFRDLRRTGAVYLMESGQNLRTIQEFLGHKNLTMTQRYLPISNNYIRAAGDALAQSVPNFF